MDDDAKYTMVSVAKAVGRDVNTVKNYTRRDREIIKRGASSLFTFRRAVQTGLTFKLVDLGLRPEFAARVAFEFTDVGQEALPGRPERMPLEVFETGSTFLCIYPNENCDIKPSKPTDAAALLFVDFQGVKHSAVTLVDITRYVETFRAALEKEVNG